MKINCSKDCFNCTLKDCEYDGYLEGEYELSVYLDIQAKCLTNDAYRIRREYDMSEAGKARTSKYNKSMKRKTSRNRYNHSEKGVEARQKYEKSAKRNEARIRWNNSANGKAYRRKYEQTEKRKEYMRKYNHERYLRMKAKRENIEEE